jgi:hypothetical protein
MAGLARRGVQVALAAWLLVTGVALVGMYKLWWTRERVLYFHRSAAEQRMSVVTRAGLPTETLTTAAALDRAWPETARYTAEGSEVTLSYAKYLLIPRIPSGSDPYRLTDAGGFPAPAPGAPPVGGSRPSRPMFSTLPATPRGLLASFTILAGFALGLRAWLRPLRLSFPEGLGLAAFGLCGAVLLAKGFLGGSMPAFAGVTAAGISGAAWSGWRCAVSRRQGGVMPPAVGCVPGAPRVSGFLAVFVLIAAAIAVWSFLMAFVVVPDDWDAWAQWGPKAKVLALGNGPLSDVRFFVPGSGDYPLLWPSVWAFSGWCAGGWEEQWSKGWGPLFLMLTAWQIRQVVRHVTGRGDYGLVAATVFISMPAVPLVASWAYAESPLWLMMVSALGRLMAWRLSRRASDLALGAVFAAAAAYTKNEGVLFAALALLWVLVNCAGRIPWRAAALPVLLVLVLYAPWAWYVRLNLGLSDHATQGLADPGGWALAVRRLGPALAQIMGIWRDLRQWNLVLPVLLAGALGLGIRGPAGIRRDLLIPMGMLAGFLAILLFHPADIQWQLGVAWSRLTIQAAVPLTVIVACGLADVQRGTRPEKTSMPAGMPVKVNSR